MIGGTDVRLSRLDRMSNRLTIWACAGLLMLTAACTGNTDHAPKGKELIPAASSDRAHPSASASHPAPTPHPPRYEEEVAAAHGDVNISASTKKGSTVVPPEVAGKWRAATFIVVDRESSQAAEVTVPLEGEYAFGDGHLKLFLHHFLPDLKINDDNVFTSVSNNPENPAAHVTVYEDGKEVFDGWLFSEFPGMHPFQHPRFGVTLKEGVPS